MLLSSSGRKMAQISGLRSIMDDIATTTAGSSAGWLNLSIGNPTPLPEVVEMWQGLAQQALTEGFAGTSCAYGPSRGTGELVGAIVDYFRRRYGWPLGPENVVVGPGSQMLAFSAAALFTGPTEQGPRRLLLPMVPEYTGYQGMALDTGTIVAVPPRREPEDDRRFTYRYDPDRLRAVPDVGMILVSSPCNPSGRTVSGGELDLLAELAEAHDVPLVVDNAYGEPFPRIVRSQVQPRWNDRTINLFSSSKAGLPGARVGFAIGPARYLSPIVSFVANSVLHAPQLHQSVLARALAGGGLDRLVGETIGPHYAARRLLAEKLLADALPADVDWRVHTSDGGMFCWLWVDHDWFDDMDLYLRMKRKNVFVVPGRHFFGDVEDRDTTEHARRCVRISLSAEEPVLLEGIARLGEAVAEQRRER